MSYAMEVARKEQKYNSIVKTMEIGAFKASLMRAQRLTGEGIHGLPSGTKVDVFPIAALPGCPDGWVRAAGTYVCPVDADWGLWFDWTMNDVYNTAIIPSVKGMNPITGQKINHIGMEQYRDKCPIHGTDFSHDRYCEKCDYKWPPQNYVCYPDTLWWDGFRSPDGHVRQFFFTDEEKKDIASLVIGKENTVPAFGFVFYQTKNPRNIQPPRYLRGEPTFFGPIHTPQNWNIYGADEMVGASLDWTGDDSDDDVKIIHGGGTASVSYNANQSHPKKKAAYDKKFLRGEIQTSAAFSKPVKDVSVGGGARINQSLSPDPLALDAWTEKESGLIRLYFVFEEQFRQIVEKGGIKDISGTEEGYLSGLPLG